MIHTARARSGFSLIEMLTALVIVALLTALATPAFRGQVDRIRVKSTLDRVVAELYRARMIAVESGGPAQVVFHSDAAGCVQRVSTVSHLPVSQPPSFRVTLPGLCLRHSGDSILAFNSRGMIRPPTRSIHARYGTVADSVVLSIAGRIRRSYRRGPGRKRFRKAAKIARSGPE